MADVSFSLSRNGGAISVLAAGSQTITEGTATPGAGDLEVRISGTAGWTRLEIEQALDLVEMYLLNYDTTAFGV